MSRLNGPHLGSGSGAGSLFLLVIPTRNDRQLIVINRVNQPITLVDSTRPEAGQIFFQWLGFTNPFKGFCPGVFDQSIDSLERLFVLGLPVDVV